MNSGNGIKEQFGIITQTAGNKGVTILAYLLAPWNRVLLEKLTGSQPIKKFPAFYGTRRFITVFTRAHYLSLS
jgi:hypothetical protein